VAGPPVENDTLEVRDDMGVVFEVDGEPPVGKTMAEEVELDVG
jgi:hypothetical protein